MPDDKTFEEDLIESTEEKTLEEETMDLADEAPEEIVLSSTPVVDEASVIYEWLNAHGDLANVKQISKECGVSDPQPALDELCQQGKIAVHTKRRRVFYKAN